MPIQSYGRKAFAAKWFLPPPPPPRKGRVKRISTQRFLSSEQLLIQSRKLSHTEHNKEADKQISEQVRKQTTRTRPYKTNSDGKTNPLKNYRELTTQTDCKAITNIGYCETSNQLKTTPGALKKVNVVCFMHDSRHLYLRE